MSVCESRKVLKGMAGERTLPSFEVCLLTAAKGVSSGISRAFMMSYGMAQDASHRFRNHSIL